MQNWIQAILNLDSEGWRVLLLILAGFALGFVLSTVVALMPALIIRYIFFRKPLPKRTARLIYIPTIIVSMIAFKVINNSPSGTIIPWIIFYFIGHWILTRETKNKSSVLSAKNEEVIQTKGKPSEIKKSKIELRITSGNIWSGLSVLAIALLVLILLWFVWPTPFKDMGFPDPRRPVRQNRFSGDIEQWDWESGSWKKYEKGEESREQKLRMVLEAMQAIEKEDKQNNIPSANLLIDSKPR